jgi:hypothetical protein
MCGIALDALALIALVMALNQDDSPDFFKAALAALGIAVIGGLAAYGVVAISPLLALILVPLLLAAAAAFVLWIVFDVPPAKAAIGGGFFAAYKLIFIIGFAFLFPPRSRRPHD